MSDISIPGVTSRFNTEKMIEDLMNVERVPLRRMESTVETLQSEKGYWQDVGRLMTTLRESSRVLYSFQNPFGERIASSSDEFALTATADRDALEQERFFTIKQAAQADRFLSAPLEKDYKIPEGSYSFTVGEDEISFNYRGGTVDDFVSALNRRGRDKLKASTLTVQPGKKSLIVESLVTGAAQKLGFSDAAEKLAIESGMVEKVTDSARDIRLAQNTVQVKNAANSASISFGDGTLNVGAESSANIPIGSALPNQNALTLEFEIATQVRNDDDLAVMGPPPGPSIPGTGSISYGGIVIESDNSTVPMPAYTPPEPPKRVDDMNVLFLTFSDGTNRALPPIHDSESFDTYQYDLGDVSGGKTIVSIDMMNKNTNRDVSIRNITMYDPNVSGGFKPRNAVSQAQDAIILMDGIEIQRPTNTIDDLIPDVTLRINRATDDPVSLRIEPDRESIKDAIYTMVGGYNQLMADINVLRANTNELNRNDQQIIQELTYLTDDEVKAFEEKAGAFSGDTTLNQFKNSMQRIVTSPYTTVAEKEVALLSQVGIGTDVRRSGMGGYSASRMRGYLEIDEDALDAALLDNLPAVQQLFGQDSDGDMIVDSGIAFALDGLMRSYVETGGIISLKTGTIDSKINQEERRIETLDTQLARKEDNLKRQYGAMEGAYNRMESIGSSLDQFSQRNSNQ
ncbi:MAG: flagellar filament capping protein FliD [Treponema sp.]|jgi:flagellar hook-associated protein 2|nr:flagellar filament capping protein FliD [Treponema sp.]